ncbi:MAG: TGS domain-containing protein, partial [Silvanigrellaceae bacterium]|nr:TGS domain-containing protein [Silvanigrellaceae bacterium]
NSPILTTPSSPKMSDKQIEFEDIYDLFALRVIVSSTSACYETLGIIHNCFRPVPGRFKDFIAMPKANLYQSLHTTVLASKGELLEIQIRTQQMHEIAENGIAAHWAYKERKKESELPPISHQDIEKFSWLKSIVNHQKEINDSNEFLEAVKVDLFDDEVYVFSPKGDVFELRKGSSCLDFAFAIHTDLGLRTTGAKINGRIASLRTKLHSGDVIELLSGNKIRATKDWLNFVFTSRAKNKIRGWLRSEERTNAREIGQELLEEALSLQGSNIDKLQKAGVFQDVNKLFSVGGYEDLLLQIGYGKLDAKAATTKLLGLLTPHLLHSPSKLEGSAGGALSTGGAGGHLVAEAALNQGKHQNAAFLQGNEHKRSDLSQAKLKKGVSHSDQENLIYVEGMQNILVRVARCCEPLPGQSIVGFVSRSRGVVVHSASCQWALSNDPARQVLCAWNKATKGEHNVRIRITTHDRPGMLASLTKLISSAQINISGMECFTNPQKRAVILLRLTITDVQQLKDIHQKIEALENIIHVERLTS